jgi:quercetin dioxygenase-like cupin family protein
MLYRTICSEAKGRTFSIIGQAINRSIQRYQERRSTMQIFEAVEDLRLGDAAGLAQPLWADEHSRILRFVLQPGDSIKEHHSRNSPFYALVLKGRGVFTENNGTDHEVGPHDFVQFDVGEDHAIRALGEELVFVGFQVGVGEASPMGKGGILGRGEDVAE